MEKDSDGCHYNDDDYIVRKDSVSSGNEFDETLVTKLLESKRKNRKCLGSQLFIVMFDCLLQLLQFCSKCGSSICDVQTAVKGASLTVTTNCLKGHKSIWHSQPNSNGRSSLIIRQTTSMHVCGVSFSLFKEFAHTLGLKDISNNGFYKIIKQTRKCSFSCLTDIGTFEKCCVVSIVKLVTNLIHKTKRNYCHTRRLKSFHSVVFKYKPKINHFNYDGMVARTILSILDFNHNLGRPQTGRKPKYSKRLKKWVGVNTYKSKRHD
ncbi:hypothetical protein PR048_002637 [Dryococelus australis]|uniref:Uncharacterized protein n=1 Tax=Dryococelus australis TaxID=614101 RepID=A0ABQ9ILT1_9NEOP|nr:hypothetical protein PR048_002637 [Dryococelus australis]